MPVIGYGLVVGLNKTGDRKQTIFSAQTLANMLERFGVAVSPDAMKVENIAAVLVTAEIGPYAQNGGRIDVMASSIGDARSLQGGTLLPTPLRGPDGARRGAGAGAAVDRRLRRRRRRQLGAGEPPHRRPRAARRAGAGVRVRPRWSGWTR